MDHEGNRNSDKNTSDEQGGGIFSTPELSVNTENLPAAEAELSEDNKSRIAAAFQGTEASQKQAEAREMNEAALARSDIPSTATDDIKLPGGKKKHRKAPLIILAVLALLAVSGGIVWYGAQSGWFGGEAPVAETNPFYEAKVVFARYANYLLFGEEKDVLDGEFEANRTYTVDEQLESETFDQEYWSKAGGLLMKTEEILTKIDNNEKDQLVSAFRNYLQNFQLVKTYYK